MLIAFFSLRLTIDPESLSSSSCGSGCGVAICRAQMETNGEGIWVELRERRGTLHHFTLPLPIMEEYSYGQS